MLERIQAETADLVMQTPEPQPAAEAGPSEAQPG